MALVQLINAAFLKRNHFILTIAMHVYIFILKLPHFTNNSSKNVIIPTMMPEKGHIRKVT